MAHICPIALPSIYCTDFIKYILQFHPVPTTLVVCSSRQDFLEHLQATIHHTHPLHQADSSVDSLTDVSHPFLIPTIHLLATSRTITLAFTPTLPHLRAYLATFHTSSDPADFVASTLKYEKAGMQTPILAILGLVALHRSTSEFSAQGLSRTLANAVEAATRVNMKLLLAESRSPQESEDLLVVGDPNSGSQEMDSLKEQLPLLSNSIKFGNDERVWAGRTIEVAKVIKRWCRFVTSEEVGIL